ncbi:MAG: ROK family protein [Proteobacteria bacterium]|nr:ROK family protein [Pseudomonadota bacterium]
MNAVGIDIGGSGIKCASVNVWNGTMATGRHRSPTPQPSTPEAVTATIAALLSEHEWSGSLGITIPGVVTSGIVRTAANIDDGWIDLDAQEWFTDALGRPVTVINDADAAGIAEARFGAGRDIPGTVLLLTFGTGIGSALLHDGVLVPNTELGHLEFHGGEAETYAAARLVKKENKRIDWWALRVNELLAHIEVLLSPRLIIVGGGISKRFDEFKDYLTTDADLVAAELGNNAGIVGAAFEAHKETT